MGQQLIINQQVDVVSTKKHAATIVEHRLSDPTLMILEFGWKMAKAHFHLYRQNGADWEHLFKANDIDQVVNKARVI